MLLMIWLIVIIFIVRPLYYYLLLNKINSNFNNFWVACLFLWAPRIPISSTRCLVISDNHRMEQLSLRKVMNFLVTNHTSHAPLFPILFFLLSGFCIQVLVACHVDLGSMVSCVTLSIKIDIVNFEPNAEVPQNISRNF